MRYVLITGGTSGIGFELARKFARENYDIVIVSANAENLENAKSRLENEFESSVVTVRQDLSRPGAAPDLYEKLRELGISISILVNNAGFGALGSSDEIDFSLDERLMILNIVTPVELCKLFLPDMYKAGEGKILNVASTGAFQPGPYTSTYYASKAFILSYSRAIRHEAKPKEVQVCTLCPGATSTRFFEREGAVTPKLSMSAERVADAAYRGLMKGKEIIVPGLLNKLLRLVPVRIRIIGIARLKSKAIE